jgi:hypothetical protein
MDTWRATLSSALFKRVLLRKGATKAEVVPRLHDKGVDILATFLVSGVAELKVGVQVKHHKGTTANGWIDQLLKGLDAENLTNGWFVTSETFEQPVACVRTMRRGSRPSGRRIL